MIISRGIEENSSNLIEGYFKACFYNAFLNL